jgi:hypothetical protein
MASTSVPAAVANEEIVAQSTARGAIESQFVRRSPPVPSECPDFRCHTRPATLVKWSTLIPLAYREVEGPGPFQTTEQWGHYMSEVESWLSDTQGVVATAQQCCPKSNVDWKWLEKWRRWRSEHDRSAEG